MRNLLVSLFVVLLVAGALAQAGAKVKTPSDVVRDYVAAQNRGDIDAMVESVADPMTIHLIGSDGSPQGSVSEDKAALRKRFASMKARNPKVQFKIKDLIANGAKVISTEQMTGMTDAPPSTGTSIYFVRDGKISTLWVIASDDSSK